jgi:DNA repair exonuclease SbcCD ATPase subunit
MRSKTHQERAAHHLAKLGPTDSFPSDFAPMDFNILQAPVTVFAHPGQQNLATLRNQYFQAMDRDAHEKTIRTTFMESRVAEMQTKIKEQIDHVDSSLRTFERKATEQREHMAELRASSEDKHKELSREVTDRISSINERSEDELHKMEARIASSEETSTSKIDDMNRILARSDHRNINQIENMAERVKAFEKKTEGRLSEQTEKIKDLERINEGQNETIHDLEAQYQLLTEALQRRESGEESFHKAMTDQMEAHLQQTKKQMATFEQKVIERFEDKYAEQLKIMQQQGERIQKLEKTSTKVRSLERKVEEQQASIKRFEVVLPAVLEDFQKLQEFVADTECRTATRQSVSPTKSRVSIAT